MTGARPLLFRVWLANGDQVLQSVESAVEFLFAPPALAEAARRVRELEAADAADADDLSVARAEVQQSVATDFGPATVIAFAAGYGFASMYYDYQDYVHSHH